MEKYYSTDLSLSINVIEAKSIKHANNLMHKFIDKIAPIMANKIRWEECDWIIEENKLEEVNGIWVVTKTLGHY